MAEKELENLASMSLGDHLEELRVCLIRAIVGIFIGLIICLIFGKTLIGIMAKPFETEMEKLQKEAVVDVRDSQDPNALSDLPQAVIVTYDEIDGYKAYTSYKKIGKLLADFQQATSAAKDPNAPPPDQTAPLDKKVAIVANHPEQGLIVYATEDQLDQLITRLIESKVIADNSQPILLSPKRNAVIVTHGPVEGFMVYIKTSMLFGLLLTSPWVIWQIWSFVSAGLYRKEKKYVRVVSPISAALFITGGLFFMLVVAPLVMRFLIRFDAAMGVQSMWSLQKYINMVFSLTLVFGVAFQMPIAIVFAEMLGLVSVEALSKNRKFVVLGLVVVAAMATPPDVISQISLAIPLYGLYEASIIFCRIRRARMKRLPE